MSNGRFPEPCVLPAAIPGSAVNMEDVSLVIHLYQPPSSSRLTEFSTSPLADEDGDSDVPAASVLELPSLDLEGVWDSLIYDGEIKEKLLNYIYSTMLFSDALVDFNIVTWNRCVHRSLLIYRSINSQVNSLTLPLLPVGSSCFMDRRVRARPRFAARSRRNWPSGCPIGSSSDRASSSVSDSR